MKKQKSKKLKWKASILLDIAAPTEKELMKYIEDVKALAGGKAVILVGD